MLSFSDKGWEHYLGWQEEDKKTLKKINKLMRSIDRDGAAKGEGQPEKLKNLPDTYSRRIDDKNRLVYIANSGNYAVTSCRGHYDD